MAESESERMIDEQGDNVTVLPTTEANTCNLLSQWLRVSVKEPTKKVTTTLKIQDSYVVYLIETKITNRSLINTDWLEEHTDGQGFPEILSTWRRYSEFDLLRDYLIVTHPTVIVPPLPEKRSTSAWQAAVVDKTDPEFIERRRAGLEQFLKRLVDILDVSQDAILLGFLKKGEDWKELVDATNYQSHRDSKLRALSASYRIKRPHEKFEVIRKYSSELENCISGILKNRAKSAEHLYGIHKIHANYGREFSQWSSIERSDMAESLQKIGHFMDAFAQDIDVAVENEEDFADQLKEYFGYCDSLRHICKKQEVMQLELEQAEDTLEAKQTEREGFFQGKTGLFGGIKAKMFGAATAEQKEEKLKALDEQILELEEKVRTQKESNEAFERTALGNIERFHRQKTADITDTLINFIIMTIDRCKKSKATWASIKEACDAI